MVWPLAAMTLAKVWPAIALPLRYWRHFLIALAAFAVISLPWLYLWPEWITTLVNASAHPPGPVVPVQWVARAAIAALLLTPPATLGAGLGRRHLQPRPLLGTTRGAGGASEPLARAGRSFRGRKSSPLVVMRRQA